MEANLSTKDKKEKQSENNKEENRGKGTESERESQGEREIEKGRVREVERERDKGGQRDGENNGRHVSGKYEVSNAVR